MRPESRARNGAKVRQRCERVRWTRAVLGLLVLLASLVSAAGIAAQSTAPVEYQLKANFLAQFPNFTEWPDGAFSSPHTNFLICVYGDFSFGTALAEATRSETFHNRKMEVRWVRKAAELRACQIVFVSRSEAHRYGKVLADVAGEEILTVGETCDFLALGGAVCMSFENEGLQFEVNLAALSGARLKMSSRLLTLARRVLHSPEAAKS